MDTLIEDIAKLTQCIISLALDSKSPLDKDLELFQSRIQAIAGQVAAASESPKLTESVLKLTDISLLDALVTNIILSTKSPETKESLIKLIHALVSNFALMLTSKVSTA